MDGLNIWVDAECALRPEHALRKLERHTPSWQHSKRHGHKQTLRHGKINLLKRQACSACYGRKQHYGDDEEHNGAMQVTSPSGKAIFKFDFTAAGNKSYVDVLVCREPEPGNLPLSDGTVTCYRNDTFIWWAPDARPALAFARTEPLP